MKRKKGEKNEFVGNNELPCGRDHRVSYVISKDPAMAD